MKQPPADLEFYLLFFLGFLADAIPAPAMPAAPAASPAGIPLQLKHTLRMSIHPLPKQMSPEIPTAPSAPSMPLFSFVRLCSV